MGLAWRRGRYEGAAEPVERARARRRSDAGRARARRTRCQRRTAGGAGADRHRGTARQGARGRGPPPRGWRRRLPRRCSWWTAAGSQALTLGSGAPLRRGEPADASTTTRWTTTARSAEAVRTAPTGDRRGGRRRGPVRGVHCAARPARHPDHVGRAGALLAERQGRRCDRHVRLRPRPAGAGRRRARPGVRRRSPRWPSNGPPTWPSCRTRPPTTRSPACPTACCSSTGSSRRWPGRARTARPVGRAVHRPRPLQGRQRQPRPRGRRPSCCGASATRLRRGRARRATPWPASAATSSWCCCDGPRGDPDALERRRADAQAVAGTPVAVGATTEVLVTASIGIALDAERAHAARGPAARRRRRHVPGQGRGRGRRRGLRRRACAGGPSTASTLERRPAPRLEHGELVLHYQPSSTCGTARRRRRGAGALEPPRARACSRPPSSSPWPRRPG